MPKDDLDEFITLEDDDQIPKVTTKPTVNKETPSQKSNKLLYIIVSILTVLAFASIAIVSYLYLHKKEQKKAEDVNTTSSKIVQEIKAKEQEALITQSNSYQKMIEDAKRLYKDGKRDEALKLQQKLSNYNRALAYYNLGVADIKNGKFESAVEKFKISCKNPKLDFESTLNIAISYYKQGKLEKFNRYLKRAQFLLASQASSPLFSYYKALIGYYSSNFPETLVPLRHPTANFYKQEQLILKAKLYTSVKNQTDAIKIFENKTDDLFALGLLYATKGEYDLSKKTLEKVIKEDDKNQKAKIALSLIDNKLGLLKSSADTLNRYKQVSTKTGLFFYPIEVKLKESLFDPVIAQREFKKNIFFDERNRLLFLFYFAPFELTSLKQSIQNINKGANFVYINQFKLGRDDLEKSKDISESNIMTNRAILDALNKDLYSAKDNFLKALEKNPNSSILHYNLALTYAKLSMFQEAFKHFKKSSILDRNNQLANIFMEYCNKLLYKKVDEDRIKNLHNQELTPSSQDVKEALLLSILNNKIYRGQIGKLNSDIFSTALKMFNAHMLGDRKSYLNEATKLKEKIPNDIVTNILYIDATHDKEEIKDYARSIQNNLISNKLDYSSIDKGYTFARELYANILNIAGVVHTLRDRELKLSSQENSIATMQTLALSDIYLKNFKEAFDIYNSLIDKKKIQDSNTLFLAAVSAIGAKQHANAIALLELAKLTNSANFESRYALGLLYQEAKNLDGATILYSKIGDIGFKSRYFTFALK